MFTGILADGDQDMTEERLVEEIERLIFKTLDPQTAKSRYS